VKATINQAASLMGLSRYQVYRRIKAGKLTARPDPRDGRKKLVELPGDQQISEAITNIFNQILQSRKEHEK
jgi:transposase